MNPKELRFEDAMQELEDIVHRLEGGECDLDDSLRLFERGVELVRFCTGRLQETERKVEVILRKLDEQGNVSSTSEQLDFPLEEGAS